MREPTSNTKRKRDSFALVAQTDACCLYCCVSGCSHRSRQLSHHPQHEFCCSAVWPRRCPCCHHRHTRTAARPNCDCSRIQPTNHRSHPAADRRTNQQAINTHPQPTQREHRSKLFSSHAEERHFPRRTTAVASHTNLLQIAFSSTPHRPLFHGNEASNLHQNFVWHACCVFPACWALQLVCLFSFVCGWCCSLCWLCRW